MIKPQDFARRRKQIMRTMGEGGIAIIPAAPIRSRNRDVEYTYRQDSDFMYVTGFGEPEAVAVLIPGRKAAEYVLFVRDKDETKEIWDGRRAGPEGACELYGADDAFPIDDIDDILPGLMEPCEHVFYTMGLNPEFDSRVVGWINNLKVQARSGTHVPGGIISLDPMLHDMRLYKSRSEVSTMRKAANISAVAHKRAMQVTKPGMWEYEVEAEFLHEFRRNGCDTAYNSIVGGGANSCILHYVDNNMQLNDGDLLLIDAGAELDCYASDITRTFPVNGKFSPEQKAIYEIVLESQLAAIDVTRAGHDWNAPHNAAVQVLVEGLVDLGLLAGKVDDIIENGDYRRFYMHKTGHWLGLDVHDVGDYKVDNDWRELEPGMVTTVEPGLYIGANQAGVDERWWNIGVRIEDDVLVTKDEPDVLSKKAPKSVADIEAIMNA